MRTEKLPLLLRLVGILAAALAAAGIVLETWCTLDRSRGGAIEVSASAVIHDVLSAPTAASFARLARANTASGNMDGAAYAAGVAARLAPGDATYAAEADRAMNAAVRERARGVVRPAASVAIVTLAALGLLAWHRRRSGRALVRTLSSARGRIRILAEGSRPAPGNAAMLDATTRALVLDVEVPTAVARLRRGPPVVVYLSSASADRTVRLSPRTDLASGAVRWRIEGETLAAIAAHPGRWRVVVRAGPAVLAESAVLVTPSARSPLPIGV